MHCSFSQVQGYSYLVVAECERRTQVRQKHHAHDRIPTHLEENVEDPPIGFSSLAQQPRPLAFGGDRARHLHIDPRPTTCLGNWRGKEVKRHGGETEG